MVVQRSGCVWEQSVGRIGIRLHASDRHSTRTYNTFRNHEQNLAAISSARIQRTMNWNGCLLFSLHFSNECESTRHIGAQCSRLSINELDRRIRMPRLGCAIWTELLPLRY